MAIDQWTPLEYGRFILRNLGGLTIDQAAAAWHPELSGEALRRKAAMMRRLHAIAKREADDLRRKKFGRNRPVRARKSS